MEQLLIRKGVSIVLILFAILLPGCHNEQDRKEETPEFFELCFYFKQLPQGTSISDTAEVSAVYERKLTEKGIAVLKTRNELHKACYFTGSMPQEAAVSLSDTGNSRAGYILTAFFNKDNSTVYGIKSPGKIVRKFNDGIPLSSKLPAAGSNSDGITIKGGHKKTIRLARYLEGLQIKNELSYKGNELVLNIPADDSDRWKAALFFYNGLDLEALSPFVPGDFAVLSQFSEDPAEITVRSNNWIKIPVKNEGTENALRFSSGAMTLPYSEETLLKYLYSLSLAHLQKFSGTSCFAPNYIGTSARPVLRLFSGEIIFDGKMPDPEQIFMWISSTEKQPESYPEAFYADLLSLKIAKKLFSGSNIFLGGAELENKTLYIPFEKISQSLFRKESISISGGDQTSLYLFSGNTLSESGTIADIRSIKKVKALYGDPENSNKAIISIVTRDRNAAETIKKIRSALMEKGFEPFRENHERISDDEAWGSVSTVTEITNENKVLSLYDKDLSKINNTISIGVYRVTDKKK